MNPYSYTNSNVSYDFTLLETTSRWLRYSVSFPSAFPARYAENGTVRGEYFKPVKAVKAPLAIIIHGMGYRSVWPCHWLARSLVKRGIACFVLYLVTHSSRTPEEVKQRMPNLTPEEWFESYQISVIDVRQLIDWAHNRPELDPRQVSVLGISLGGFISAIAMGVDQRIKSGVLIVTGGNSARIVQESRLATWRRSKRSDAEYRQTQSAYAQYLAEVDEKGFENVTPLRSAYLDDPLTFARELRQRPLLMLNARWDEFVPRGATLDLWAAAGQPPIAWYPATHTSIWAFYPLISRRIGGFLRSNFANKG